VRRGKEERKACGGDDDTRLPRSSQEVESEVDGDRDWVRFETVTVYVVSHIIVYYYWNMFPYCAKLLINPYHIAITMDVWEAPLTLQK